MPASKPPDFELYGIPRPKNRPKDVISSTSSSAFASQLSSLLSTSSSTSIARSRPSKSSSGKDDIFTTHNRGAKKRALADTSDSLEQKHSTSMAPIDSSDRHRAKRKMEEKARIYAAMKRGDYIDPRASRGSTNDDRTPLVDFDRKWAEAEAEGKEQEEDTSSGDDSDESMVDYTDEFGRQRRGTRGEAVRQERRLRAQKLAKEELNEMSARLAHGNEEVENVIFGDTVQTHAFNPDAKVTEAMAELARKRDRSLTPPEETHYDASKEVRSKGVGFYQFSREEGRRKEEMKNLGGMRKETEDLETERRERREKREKAKEERKRIIRKKRGGKEADKFLDSLS